jgi:hypothetical protein
MWQRSAKTESEINGCAAPPLSSLRPGLVPRHGLSGIGKNGCHPGCGIPVREMRDWTAASMRIASPPATTPLSHLWFPAQPTPDRPGIFLTPNLLYSTFMPPLKDEERQYRRRSAALRLIGRASRELPLSTSSLHLFSLNGQSRLHAYNRTGKMVATLPTERTPKLIRDAIQRLASELVPDSDGIICPL